MGPSQVFAETYPTPAAQDRSSLRQVASHGGEGDRLSVLQRALVFQIASGPDALWLSIDSQPNQLSRLSAAD